MLQVVVQVDRCKVVAGAGTSRGTPYQPIQHPPGSTWGSALVVHAAVITQMKAPKHGCRLLHASLQGHWKEAVQADALWVGQQMLRPLGIPAR
jgi:hypothetical protein